MSGSDEELMVLVRDGDEKAFGLLYLRHDGRLRSLFSSEPCSHVSWRG